MSVCSNVESGSLEEHNSEGTLSKDVMKNTPDCAQNKAAEQKIKKTKTIQHLLSDWRTAYAMNKKVILLDLSSYLILSICFFRKQLLGKQTLSVYLNHQHLGVHATRKV